MEALPRHQHSLVTKPSIALKSSKIVSAWPNDILAITSQIFLAEPTCQLTPYCLKDEYLIQAKASMSDQFDKLQLCVTMIMNLIS